MLLFLIPVLILAGATSIGIAAEISQGSAPATEPAAKSEARPAPPAPTKRLP